MRDGCYIILKAKAKPLSSAIFLEKKREKGFHFDYCGNERYFVKWHPLPYETNE